MQDYNKIQELFGSPLNTVPKPQVPFKLKTWHVVGGILVSYVIIKGIRAIIDENIKRFGPKINSETKTPD